MDETGAGGGGGEGLTGKTKTWDGILTTESTVETTAKAAASLTQIKSKDLSPTPTNPSPITSTFPNGAVPDSSNNHHRGLTLAPNPSVTSLVSTVTSSSVQPASSSIAAVAPRPRPRPSSSDLATPAALELPAVMEHVLRQPSSTSTVRTEVNQQKQQQLQGINLFRFDPLRTLQFLTLELKSKLKPLVQTIPGGAGVGANDDATSAHKQLYKISKELLYAVKILTENAEIRRKETIDGNVSSKATSCGVPEAPGECQNCLKLQNVLNQRLQVEQPRSCLPRMEINYHQDALPQTESSKASKTDQRQQQQLQLHLEGEIKRLQTMISDKQTTTAATVEALIKDLNRKLDEATHARDEAQRKLLNATLENERLTLLLRSQCSTMANLRHDFSAIHSLADQQIDLLDRTNGNEPGGLNDCSRSKSNTIETTTAVNVVGNHHRNYRYPSGSAASPGVLQVAQLNPTPTVEQVAKLHKRHYSFQNIAEKESDDGNDAANDYWRNSASQQQQQQQQKLREPPQEPEVMLRLPSSTLTAEDAFLQQREDMPPSTATGLWQKKNRAAVELEKSGTSSVSSGSLSAVVNSAARLARFGPAKRALLIDSDRDDDLKDDLEGRHHQQHSSSSLSSLKTSQQQQQRGQERKDDQLNNEESCSDYTNNSNDHVQNRKTNDCASFVPKDDEMATNRQQLGPGKNKKDDTFPGCVEAKGKFPRDYGDKFERRESLLALSKPGLVEKELCQNRPIMGQIRRRRSSPEIGNRDRVAEKGLEGKITSDANEPTSGQTSRMVVATTTTTEEFSIDFDDITLPASPVPFRRRDEGKEPAEELPSSFGDWM